jgi:urocanate hydratase
MGGAQPMAVTMNEGTCLIADVDRARIDFRVRTKYLDEAVSIGVCGNATELLARLIERGVTPEVLTDQTSAHDPLNGYVPEGMALAEALSLRGSDPDEYQRRSYATMGAHGRAMLELQRRGSETFDFPGFVPAYIHSGSVILERVHTPRAPGTDGPSLSEPSSAC